MLWGASLGALEVRAEGGTTRLHATFPYGAETELAPGRRELIAPFAFTDRIDRGDDIHLLSGHSYEKPLASRASGSLRISETESGLELEADIETGTTWARDFLAAHTAGLVRGLSPGFRVLPNGEKIERRGQDYIRTVTKAALFEFSAVTKPAYSEAQIEARAWQASEYPPDNGLVHSLKRWRL